MNKRGAGTPFWLEQQDHEKETRQSSQEIQDLKEELQKNKTISEIEVAFEEKRLKSQLTADEREFAQKEKTLQATWDHLAEAISLETNVHKDCTIFGRFFFFNRSIWANTLRYAKRFCEGFGEMTGFLRNWFLFFRSFFLLSSSVHLWCFVIFSRVETCC